MSVEQPHKYALGLVAGFWVVPGLPRTLVGDGDERERVGFGFKVVDPGG